MANRLIPQEIGHILEPYLGAPAAEDVDWPRILPQLATYLELLLKWNARLNLTAIRAPEAIVLRHFGESLFAGLRLFSAPGIESGTGATMLDFGSGAGFPGIPIQILRPRLHVTLAESRQKKAAFLREAVRELGLEAEVWSGRVEDMPPVRAFDVVALRAVDEMKLAVAAAARRALDTLAILGTRSEYPARVAGFEEPQLIAMPQSEDRSLIFYRRKK